LVEEKKWLKRAFRLNWTGVGVPKNTPAEIDKLNKEINAVLADAPAMIGRQSASPRHYRIKSPSRCPPHRPLSPGFAKPLSIGLSWPLPGFRAARGCMNCSGAALKDRAVRARRIRLTRRCRFRSSRGGDGWPTADFLVAGAAFAVGAPIARGVPCSRQNPRKQDWSDQTVWARPGVVLPAPALRLV
jgi:hypothetical protein